MQVSATVKFLDGDKAHKAIMSDVQKKTRVFHKQRAVALATGFASSLPGSSLASSVSADKKRVGRRGSKMGWFARAGVKFALLVKPSEDNGKTKTPNIPAFHEFGAYGNRERLGDFGKKRVSEKTRAAHGKRFYIPKGEKDPKHVGVIKGKHFLASWIKRSSKFMGVKIASIYGAAYIKAVLPMKEVK